MVYIKDIANKLTKKDDQTQQLIDLNLRKNQNFVFEEEKESLRFKRSRR